MKHLANCTPTEFMKQAVKVRRPFREWIERTGIPAIRARRPEGFEDMTPDERREALIIQSRENMADIVAAAIEEDFEGTVNLLCLATFTDPAEFDSHPFSEYLSAVNAMLSDEGVKGFFTLCP